MCRELKYFPIIGQRDNYWSILLSVEQKFLLAFPVHSGPLCPSLVCPWMSSPPTLGRSCSLWWREAEGWDAGRSWLEDAPAAYGPGGAGSLFIKPANPPFCFSCKWETLHVSSDLGRIRNTSFHAFLLSCPKAGARLMWAESGLWCQTWTPVPCLALSTAVSPGWCGPGLLQTKLFQSKREQICLKDGCRFCVIICLWTCLPPSKAFKLLAGGCILRTFLILSS